MTVCGVSIIHSRRAGTLFCSAFLQQSALRPESCWCLSFNKYLIDYVDHQRSWVLSLGPLLLLSCRYCMWNLYNECLNFQMCQGSPTFTYSLNYRACSTYQALGSAPGYEDKQKSSSSRNLSSRWKSRELSDSEIVLSGKNGPAL